jgi:hypothetical protein
LIRGIALLAISAAFALAGYVTVQVNGTPRYAVTSALKLELGALLLKNGLTPMPMADPRGQLIDAALRFKIPECPVDGFLLPLSYTTLTDVQAIRFSEITGAFYRSTTLNIAVKGSILEARVARALSSLRYAFGQETVRNDHTVLALFTPLDCAEPVLDMRAFWLPQSDTGKQG